MDFEERQVIGHGLFVGNILPSSSVRSTAETFGFDVDYERLLKEFQGRGALLRAFYYTAVIEDQEFSSIRPLVD